MSSLDGIEASYRPRDPPEVWAVKPVWQPGEGGPPFDENNSAEVMHTQIAAGAKVDQAGQTNGSTALMLAAEGQREGLADLLVAAAASREQ